MGAAYPSQELDSGSGFGMTTVDVWVFIRPEMGYEQ
jgi:hypothetical protein